MMFDICRVKNSYTCTIQVDTDLDLKKQHRLIVQILSRFPSFLQPLKCQ